MICFKPSKIQQQRKMAIPKALLYDQSNLKNLNYKKVFFKYLLLKEKQLEEPLSTIIPSTARNLREM